MNRCEDFPCCGHTFDDPCVSTYDPYSDPHLMCDHETGICEMWEDEEDEDEDTPPLEIYDPRGLL